MINAAITGGETIIAGELIRILINHPDVNILAVASDSKAGCDITSVHRGMIGDISAKFVPEISRETIAKANIVFLCGEPWEAEMFMKSLPPEEAARTDNHMRIVDLSGQFRLSHACGMVYGLPESNRKALVRGAVRCSVPSAAAMAVELAIFPLLKNAILPDRIYATVETASSEDFITESQSIAVSPDISTRFDPVAPAQYRSDADAITAEIMGWIKSINPDYNGEIKISLTRSGNQRGTIATVDIPSPTPAGQIVRFAEECYDDHSFAYIIPRRPDAAEVANTNKCLIHIGDPTSPDDLGSAATDTMAPASLSQTPLRVTAVIDNLVKGGAGNAVHCMNLMFGLSERTGLALKASVF